MNFEQATQIIILLERKNEIEEKKLAVLEEIADKLDKIYGGMP